jgi:S-adenosyl methyltransferase
VLVKARALLAGDPQTVFIHERLQQVDAILAHPDTRRLIDFNRPMAALLVAIMHFIPDEDDPRGIVAAIGHAMPSGSYLVLSHVTTDGSDPEVVAQIERTYANAPAPLILRSGDEIAAMLDVDGYELLSPGLVNVAQWPDSHRIDPDQLNLLGGVIRKR